MPQSETPLQRVERLRIERAELVDEMRAISEKAERGRRNLYPDESKRFKDTEARFDGLSTKIQSLEEEHGFGPRLTRSAVAPASRTDAEPADERAVGLRPEERMSDWAASRFGSPMGRDASDFSLGRAIRGMVTGEWHGADVERRALSEGTDSAGGFLTPELLGSQVIDKTRKKAKVLQAGATVVPLGSDRVSFPRLATDVTGAWKAENAAVAERAIPPSSG